MWKSYPERAKYLAVQFFLHIFRVINRQTGTPYVLGLNFFACLVTVLCVIVSLNQRKIQFESRKNQNHNIDSIWQRSNQLILLCFKHNNAFVVTLQYGIWRPFFLHCLNMKRNVSSLGSNLPFTIKLLCW